MQRVLLNGKSYSGKLRLHLQPLPHAEQRKVCLKMQCPRKKSFLWCEGSTSWRDPLNTQRTVTLRMTPHDRSLGKMRHLAQYYGAIHSGYKEKQIFLPLAFSDGNETVIQASMLASIEKLKEAVSSLESK